MYLDFYDLQEEPFRITPDPDFFFLSRSHREAFASVVYGVNERKGFVMLTGEVGTGKTTVLRAYLKQAEGSGIRPIYLFDPDISFDALLRMMLRELGAEQSLPEGASLLEQLQAVLIGAFRSDQNVVLLIDEAQNIPIDTLEKLRMLSNLETEKEKLLQIVLVGQPELERKLDTHAVRQLKQRIAVRATIQPLSKKESAEYIRHRLCQAGAGGRVFSSGAVAALVRQAQGIPRTLNITCDNALIAGYGSQRRPVSTKIVANVIAELEGRRPRRRLRPVKALAVGGMALLMGSVISLAVGPGRAFVEETDFLAAATRVFGAGSVSASQAAIIPAAPQKLAPFPAQEAPIQVPEAPVATTPPRETPPTPSPTLTTVGLEQVQDTRMVVSNPPPASEDTQYVAAVATPPPESRPLPPQETMAEPEPIQQKQEAPAEPAPARIIRIAQAGDCLTRLVEEVYGSCDAELLARVKTQNPNITDVNLILAGSEIAFPMDEATTAGMDLSESLAPDSPARELDEL